MRHAAIALAAVTCLAVFMQAQTVEELVNKNIQAKGGIEKIKAIKSVRITEANRRWRVHRCRLAGKRPTESGARDVLAAGHDGNHGLRWRDRVADTAFRRAQRP